MKLPLISLFILFVSICFAQKTEFKNADKYSEWIMSYQEHPEPEKLFSAFQFGITNKKIAESGGRRLVIAFFGSIFRADSTKITEFYDKIKQHEASTDFHYGFIGSLWMANTTYSKAIMDEYLQSESAKKFKSDGAEKKPPYNLYTDPVKDVSHLDIIWADFFATGNPEDVKKIISTLSSDNEISDAAKWSLTSNGISYAKVLQVIQTESKENSNALIRKKLLTIMKDIQSAKK